MRRWPDPAAVLAEALIVLLDCLAPNGAVLLLDDLQWADPDTLSVLGSLADYLDTIPLALVLAARTEPQALSAVHQLGTQPSIRSLPAIETMLRSPWPHLDVVAQLASQYPGVER